MNINFLFFVLDEKYSTVVSCRLLEELSTMDSAKKVTGAERTWSGEE